MCTVTIITNGPAAEPNVEQPRIRLVANRDELRSRPVALSPMRRQCGTVDAILPIDPVSDGTWIAASQAGLIMTLLNVHTEITSGASPAFPMKSRGTIIPSLLPCNSLELAIKTTAALDPIDFPPFRLLILDVNHLCEVVSNGASIHIHPVTAIDRPFFFTSSGLGDHLVDPPRRALFESESRNGKFSPAVQDSFHRHTWADRPHLSVLMNREDARTVSRTTIELSPRDVSMKYEPIPATSPPPIVTMSLLRPEARV